MLETKLSEVSRASESSPVLADDVAVTRRFDVVVRTEITETVKVEATSFEEAITAGLASRNREEIRRRVSVTPYLLP